MGSYGHCHLDACADDLTELLEISEAQTQLYRRMIAYAERKTGINQPPPEKDRSHLSVVH